MGTFDIKIPPNAETGSAAKAASHASLMVDLVATPQGLVCFRMTIVGPSFSNSEINPTAASISVKLLNDSSFPANFSNISSKSP